MVQKLPAGQCDIGEKKQCSGSSEDLTKDMINGLIYKTDQALSAGHNGKMKADQGTGISIVTK